MAASLIDYHCHLDLYPEFEQLIDQCEKQKIYTLAVTTTPRAWPRNYALTKNLKYVKAALGMHPQLISQILGELSLWESYLPQARYIGEVGLDAGPRFYKSLEDQSKVFDRIVQASAAHGGKVLSVHSVRTAPRVLDTISKYKLLNESKVILHWFTGSITDVKRAIGLGCYFSINLSMLNSPKNAALIAAIPKDRILTETDGPFTQIDGKAQVPADVLNAVTGLASLWRCTTDTALEIIESNLLGIESF